MSIKLVDMVGSSLKIDSNHIKKTPRCGTFSCIYWKRGRIAPFFVSDLSACLRWPVRLKFLEAEQDIDLLHKIFFKSAPAK